MYATVDAGFDPCATPRVLGRAEAYRLGFSRRAIAHRVATGRWRYVLPRTLLTTDTFTWPDRLAAALTFAGPEAVLSGAAALTDLGLRSALRPGRVLVLVPARAGVLSHSWVQVRRTHRLPEPALLPGPRRVPVARAVADFALAADRIDDVRTLVAQAVRAGLCTLDELEVELVDGPRNGSRHLRVALSDVGAGAWSAPEARAARTMRSAGIHGFEQNVEIRTEGLTYVADFLWRRLRAVLEIDSVEHHLNPADWRATMDRHLALTAAGYSVVHRTPADVANARRFVRDIAAWLGSRAEHL